MFMVIEKIHSVDICRDGGSYSLCFDSHDAGWFELFIKVVSDNNELDKFYENPRLYKGGVNSGTLVKELSWKEAKEMIKPLSYKGVRFTELKTLVERYSNDV